MLHFLYINFIHPKFRPLNFLCKQPVVKRPNAICICKETLGTFDPF